jgi:hypothetical protein
MASLGAQANLEKRKYNPMKSVAQRIALSDSPPQCSFVGF